MIIVGENLQDIINNYSNKQPIIVIDSGLGGISIGKEIYAKLDKEDIICISDIKNVSYGNKSKREILKLINNLIKVINNFNPKAIVIGCNTIDAIGGEKIADEFHQIPVYQIIGLSSKTAIKETLNKKIAVFATNATIEEQSYMYRLVGHLPDLEVYGICCDELATLIEKGDFKNKIIDEEIKMGLDLDFDTLILGCTHYHLINHKFKKYYPDVNIIDSSTVLVDHVVKQIPVLNNGKENVEGSFMVLSSDTSDDTINRIDQVLEDIDYTINKF